MKIIHGKYCIKIRFKKQKKALDSGQARITKVRMRGMKVALVHDDLMQWGGAERVLLAISEVFPEAPIYTSVFNRENRLLTENFKDKKVVTSFIQNIPGWKSFYRAFLPLYPMAFEQFDFSEYDLVISQTTRFAKSILTKPGTIHICYCHTPPRFLWNFSGESVNKLLLPFMSKLRLYDQISSRRVDFFLAGSKNAQKRINKIYRQKSRVLLPFVDLERFKGVETFDGGYYLIISRLNKYKRVDVAVEAFKKNKKNLKIVGAGPELDNLRLRANRNIEFLGSVSDEVIVKLLSGCKGLIITAEEDFGMTSLEAQSLGKGVIAFGVGGARETIIENITGVFYYEQTEVKLGEAVDIYESVKIGSKQCIENAQSFSMERFKERLNQFVNELRNK